MKRTLDPLPEAHNGTHAVLSLEAGAPEAPAYDGFRVDVRAVDDSEKRERFLEQLLGYMAVASQAGPRPFTVRAALPVEPRGAMMRLVFFASAMDDADGAADRAGVVNALMGGLGRMAQTPQWKPWFSWTPEQGLAVVPFSPDRPPRRWAIGHAFPPPNVRSALRGP